MDLSHMGDDELLAMYQKLGGKGGGGYDAATNSAKYQDTLAQWRAKSDIKRLDDAQEIEKTAYDNQTTAGRARDVLSGDTPTGSFAGARIAAGKAIGNPFTHAITGGFVPDKQQTANLETLQQLGNQGTLDSVSKLKGPLSDRDVAFLKTLQYDPSASRTQNQRVVDAQQWAGRRQAAYAAALRTWTEKNGSPSALNPQGVSFDRWWGQYSSERLPQPSLAAAPGASPNPFARGNGKAGGGPTPPHQLSDAEIKAQLGL